MAESWINHWSSVWTHCADIRYFESSIQDSSNLVISCIFFRIMAIYIQQSMQAHLRPSAVTNG